MQSQQQPQSTASGGIESQIGAPDGAGTPRWLGGSSSASWRARASPTPWLGATAVFREPPPMMLPVRPAGAPSSLAGLSRPSTVGPGKSPALLQGYQQRPLGAVRTASSAQGAARRRARGTRAVGGPHRSPTPEPPAGQGGYLVPSRGGRVTPQQMAATAEASLGQSPPTVMPPSLSSSAAEAALTVAAGSAHASTAIVHARNGRRYRATGDSVGQAVPPETEVNGVDAAAKENGIHEVANLPSSLEEAVANPPAMQPTSAPSLRLVNENGTKFPSDGGLHSALPTVVEPLGPLRLSAAPIRVSVNLSSIPANHQPAAMAASSAAVTSGGGVTSFSYMHFHNRPPSEQPHPLYHSQQIQPSPRPRPVPSYSVDLAVSPNLHSNSTEQQQQQQQQDTEPPKPVVSISDGAGCITEIFPIKSILKKPGAFGGSAGGPPVLLSASARPQTAGGALKLLTSSHPLLPHPSLATLQSVGQQQQQHQQQSAPLETSPPYSEVPAAPSDASVVPSRNPVNTLTPVKRPLRRSASIQNGQLSLRARSQSAGPKRGVRFDMTSNSVHEYEPVPPQPLQQLPPYTADSEHWYRLMWKRLSEH